MRSLRFSMIPQGGIPTAQIFLRYGEARPFSASPTCLDTPKQIINHNFSSVFKTCCRTITEGLSILYESCPESNASYLVCSHNVRLDVSGRAAEIEPSHQYSVQFCCHETDGSRGAVLKNGIWHHWIPPYKAVNSSIQKKMAPTDIHWCLLTESLCRPTSECQHRGVVSGAFQQCQQQHERQTMLQTAMHSFHTTKQRTSWSAHPHTNQWTVTRELCTELNIGSLASMNWKQW